VCGIFWWKKKYIFTMSLKASPRPIPIGATHVSGGGVIYH